MNKLNAKARITEVDGLSDSIIRIFGADTKAQEDAFLKSQIAELTELSDADRKSTRLNSSHSAKSRMPSSA